MGPATLARIAAFALLFYGSGVLSHALSRPEGPDIPFWLPNSIYMTAALLAPLRLWPVLALVALPINLAFDLPRGEPAWVSLCLFGCDSIDAFLGAWLVRRFAAGAFKLNSRLSLLQFAAFAITLAPLTEAVLGTTALHLGGYFKGYVTNVWYWWLGDAAPALVVIPFLMAALDPGERGLLRQLSWPRLAEAAVVLALLCAVTVSISHSQMGIVSDSKYWMMALVVWFALRFGILGASFANLVLMVLLGYVAYRHQTLLSAEALPTGDFQRHYHSFVLVSSAVSLLAAVVIREGEELLVRLKREGERNRVVFEIAANGNHILDADGNLMDCNEAFRATLGYTAEEMRGMHVSQWDLRWDAQELKEIVRRNIELGSVFETRHRCKNGSVVDVEITVAGIDYGGRRCLYCCSRNISDRKALEAQLRQSQKLEAIGRLAGGIAHDFNNLLTGIGLRLDLAAHTQSLPPETSELVGEVRDLTNRAGSVVEQLLLFARQHPMRMAGIDVRSLVDANAKLIGRTIGEQITVTVRQSAGPVWVRGDPSMLDQVLVNLCLNARDAMPKGGLLELETLSVELPPAPGPDGNRQPHGRFAVIRIKDSGMGIPEEAIPRLFEPFYTTKPPGKGTGLGLAMVYSIAQQHGGWVGVESSPGSGSTFSVYLPLAEPAAPEPAAPRSELVAAGAGRILLVEDEYSVRNVVDKLLKRLGYTVTVASNGAEALAKWKQAGGGFDLLLTDTVMPGGLDGLELAGILRRERQDLKVIVMSGYNDRIARAGDLRRSGVGFLAKPFEARDLSVLLAQTLAGKS